MRTKKEINRVELTFPAKSVNEGFIRAAVAAFSAQLDPTLTEMNDIRTAVSEAVTNVIVHAYPDGVGSVAVTARILADGVVEVRVKDKGCGIEDIERARQPLFTTGGSERSGMGFSIMESFMDEFRVTSKPGHGTTVVMKKRIRMRSGARTGK